MSTPERSSNRQLLTVVAAIVVLALLALVGWRVFEHFDQQDKIKNANKSCDTFDVVKGSPTPPPGFCSIGAASSCEMLKTSAIG